MANEPDDFQYAPPTGPLEVLHVDKDVLCVVKPSGLLSVPGRTPNLQDSLYTRVLESYPLAQMVHRLDMDTSGVMVVALRRKAEKKLKMQFRNRVVQKKYEAVVAGEISDVGEVSAPLMQDAHRKLRHIVHRDGKPSSTQYRLLHRQGDLSRLELTPLTGRSHQLRVHMLHLGCPIVGDRFYAPADVCSMSPRLMLHATQLGFEHPYSGKWIEQCVPSGFDKWLSGILNESLSGAAKGDST